MPSKTTTTTKPKQTNKKPPNKQSSSKLKEKGISGHQGNYHKQACFNGSKTGVQTEVK